MLTSIRAFLQKIYWSLKGSCN